jgi:hypothetical protein
MSIAPCQVIATRGNLADSLRMGEVILVVMIMLVSAALLRAQHSHAMFDTARRATVTGTVAKVVWKNPHIFVWAYVADKSQPSGYAHYLFESGAVSLLVRQGWTKDTLKVGEKIEIDYLPLRDGRGGGAFIQARHADGTISLGDPGMLRVLNAIADSSGSAPAPGAAK